MPATNVWIRSVEPRRINGDSDSPQICFRINLVGRKKMISDLPTSMGPRFFNRGSFLHSLRLNQQYSTSMGPRFFSRGNVGSAFRPTQNYPTSLWPRQSSSSSSLMSVIRPTECWNPNVPRIKFARGRTPLLRPVSATIICRMSRVNSFEFCLLTLNRNMTIISHFCESPGRCRRLSCAATH